MNFEELAAEMLTLVPVIQRAVWVESDRTSALAVWLGRLYGYDFAVDFSPATRLARLPTACFSRVDEPGARRRAEWMRNPAADPTLPPPVAWHVNGGVGIHPPGWHPAARLVITADVERSLRYNADQFGRQRRAAYGSGIGRPARHRPDPLPGPPPWDSAPPPPPPDTIAYPDEERHA